MSSEATAETSVWFSASDEKWELVMPQPGDMDVYVAVKKNGEEWCRVIVNVVKQCGTTAEAVWQYLGRCVFASCVLAEYAYNRVRFGLL